jgi:SAM-dependent methyltransferase
MYFYFICVFLYHLSLFIMVDRKTLDLPVDLTNLILKYNGDNDTKLYSSNNSNENLHKFSPALYGEINTNTFTSKVIQKLLELGLVNESSVWLDMGCGYGNILIALAYLRYACTGVEVVKYRCQVYNTMYNELKVHQRHRKILKYITQIEGDFFELEEEFLKPITIYYSYDIWLKERTNVTYITKLIDRLLLMPKLCVVITTLPQDLFKDAMSRVSLEHAAHIDVTTTSFQTQTFHIYKKK